MKTGVKTNSASGYIRRSAIDERGEDASITYQKRYCEELAARHGLQIIEWFNEGDGSPASVFKENKRLHRSATDRHRFPGTCKSGYLLRVPDSGFCEP